MENCIVLDLGCGVGRECYLSSYLVGEKGFVIGVDMADDQLSVARKHLQSQTRAFGFSQPNIEFRHGYIEDLKTLGIKDQSIDIVISNCAINLSPDKSLVFEEIFRVLKSGGELYFSDLFSNKRLEEELLEDPEIYGESLSAAMYIEDFRHLLSRFGYPDYRVMSQERVMIDNSCLSRRIGMIDFYFMTIRVFKLETLGDCCEDYGQLAIYKGSIPGAPYVFHLDDRHQFITGKTTPVRANTARILMHTRFAPHFGVIDDFSTY